MNGHMTILQALAMAGGFTDFANRKDIRILRKTGAGHADAQVQLQGRGRRRQAREPLTLQPGDTVIVK